MYTLLVHANYRDEVDADLEEKLRRRGLTHCGALVHVLHHNFSLLPSTLPPHYRTVQFDLLMNALMTERRTRHFNKAAPRLATADRIVHPCYICGKGEDSYVHLFGGECKPVYKARIAFSSRSPSTRRGGTTTTPTLKT